MRILQYCYFALKSATVPASAITARLQLEPDEVLIRGSRDPERDRPRIHSWEIVRRGDENIHDQVEHVVNRLNPLRVELAALIADSDVTPVMQVVRYFNRDEGVEVPPDGSTWYPGRRNPLGCHLSLSTLEFLVATRTPLDIDEYD